MGEVYLARDTSLDRVVALKILPPDLAGDGERLRRFMLEAKAASAVGHANVAHIYQIGEAGGVHFIAINGRYDHVFPVELSQQPFFARLGTSPGEKAHLDLGGGHSSPRNELIQAVLAGLDRYLGSVERR